MKALIIVAALSAAVVSVAALSSNEESQDISEIVSKLGLPNSKDILIKQDLEDGLAGNDGAMATIMTNALMSSLLEDGKDGKDSIMTTIMKSNEELAEVQFRFIKRIWEQLLASPVGQIILQQLRTRLCNSGM